MARAAVFVTLPSLEIEYPMKKPTTPLPSTSPLGDFEAKGVTRTHDITGEDFTELCLDAPDTDPTRFAQLFADGTVILCGDGTAFDLNNVQAMHLANAILARSQMQSESPHTKVAEAIVESEAYREFLESVVDDPEYAYLEAQSHTPTAENY